MDVSKPADCEHGVRSCMNPLVQSFAARGKADLESAPTLQRCPAASVQFGERHFGEKANFDRANQFLFVGSGDFFSSLGIEARQNAVQMPGTMLLPPPA